MMKIAVTGASGWLGAAICDRLELAGYHVVRMSRNLRGFGGISWDLADPQGASQWVKHFEGVDTIVHCAAHVHRPRETSAEKIQFEELNVRGLERLAIASRVAGVSRIVLASSIAVYGSPRGAAMESDSISPTTEYGRSKLRAEEVAREMFARWTILRIATVYGRGDAANFKRLASALKRHRFIIPGSGSAKKSVVGIDELASFVSTCVVPWSGESSIYNVAEPRAPTVSELCRGMVAACGFEKPKALPLPILRFAALGGDVMQSVIGASPISTRIFRALTHDTEVSTVKLQRSWPNFNFGSFSENISTYSSYYRDV